jgi:hypothetical protein
MTERTNVERKKGEIVERNNDEGNKADGKNVEGTKGDEEKRRKVN